MEDGETGDKLLHGRLQSLSFRGRYQQTAVQIGDVTLRFEFDTAVPLPPVGSPIRLQLNSDGMQLM